MRIRELSHQPGGLQLSWRVLVDIPSFGDWQKWPEPQRIACNNAFIRAAALFPQYTVISDESGCKERGPARFRLWRRQWIVPATPDGQGE